jgi:DNA-binding CsgD family transcriptional regulator
MRVVDATTAVRVLPARGALGDCAIVMIEPLNGRDYLRNAAERYALTPREQQVVKLIIEGRSTEEIAIQLGITRNTVSLYVKSALAKTGSSSRAALLGRLMRPGPEFTQDRF